MFHKKTLLTLLVAGLILTVGIGITSAFGGDGFKSWGHKANLTEEQKAEMQQEKEAFTTALENNDFTAWQELMTDKPFADKITEDNFAKLVEAHQAMQVGDVETAKAIKEELGFIKYGFKGKFMHKEFKELKDINGDGVCNQLDWQVEK